MWAMLRTPTNGFKGMVKVMNSQRGRPSGRHAQNGKAVAVRALSGQNRGH